mgnify:FL=1
MINNKIKISLIENKPLLLAILLSLILHLILLSNLLIHLPKTEDHTQIFNVSLVKLQPKPQAKPQESSSKMPTTAIVNPAQPTPIPKIQSPTPIAKPLPNQTIPIITPQTTIEHAPLTAPNVIIVSEHQRHESDRNGPSSSPNTQAYKYVETEFEIRQSSNPEEININTITFTTQEESGTYRLTNVLFSGTNANPNTNNSKIVLENSEGIVTNQGLKPNYYSQQSVDGQNLQAATFAWADGSVEINKKYEKLTQGAQDEISYLYQFMYYPPSENTEILTTDGKNIYAHHFIYLGEEIIQTKLGELKTIHLSKEGEEKIEVWLAVDYQYLPVKTKKTAPDGSFVERTASKLSTTIPEIIQP